MKGLFKQGRRLGLGATAVFLALTLVASAGIPQVARAGSGSEKAIKVGHVAAFTGTLASLGTPNGEGVFDYVRFVNEQGGINGIKVEIIWEETAASLARIITTQKRLAAQGVVLFVGCTWALVPGEVQVSMAQEQQIATIDIDALDRSQLSDPQWICAAYGDWASLFVTEMKWVKENLWAEERPLKVGAIFYDTHAGWTQLEGVPYLERMGIEFVGYEVVPFVGCIDTSTELLRLAGKADWIYVTSYGATTTTIVKDAKRLGLLGKGIKFICSGQTIDECILSIVRTDADGWYAPKITPNYDETERFPGLKTYIEVERKYRGLKPEELKGFGMAGWVYGMIGLEAVRLAIEKGGYENLTGRAVRDALFSITDFHTEVVPTTTINQERPYLCSGLEMCQIKEGRFEVIEWVELPASMISEPEGFERWLERK